MTRKVLALLAAALFTSTLNAGEFTVASYNCGGLSNHYDYIRAACMQKLVQQRYDEEPENMALSEKIQQVALARLYSHDPATKAAAQERWEKQGYDKTFKILTANPNQTESINAVWHSRCEAMLSSYKVRPISLNDQDVKAMLSEHISDLTGDRRGKQDKLLQEVRAKMAKRIFRNHLQYDILCLQEADYLSADMFPSHYGVALASTAHSVNGIAWNTDKFDLVDTYGDLNGRAYAVRLVDKETQTSLVVATGHLSGCNPFSPEIDPETLKDDSAKGSGELQEIIDFLDAQEADIRLIGMDSNVAATHPRLALLDVAGYDLDTENALEPTCTNPYQVLNTRVDWIAIKSSRREATVTNIPVSSVGLNNIQTNISDHKPVAAKIRY